jgi:hypothetical protein
MAVASLQDLLGLRGEARMNTPGKMGDFLGLAIHLGAIDPGD